MPETVENIFHQYYSPLCNYAAKIIHDKNSAEDIVQALFIQLIDKKKFDSIKNIESYLLHSVRFKCIDYLRASNKNRTEVLNESLDEAFDLPHEITEEEIEPLFHYYAAKLPPKTREVFLLSRVSKLTYKEIAEELNTSIKTVENQMGSALKKIKKLLQEEHYFLLTL